MGKTLILVFASTALLPSIPSLAQSTAQRPFLSNLFADNMVLQRDRADAIWGWTTPGARVSVSIDGHTSTTTAMSDGKWTAYVPKHSAGGPYTIDIRGPQSVQLKNVLFGDVWICSGQSNMQFGVMNLANAKEEIAAANHPRIRLFMAANVTASTPRDTVPGTWSVCSPDTITLGGWGGFTAVGYFFGRDLQRDLNVPIGLVETTWGGTPAEAWTSRTALETMPDFANVDQTVANALLGSDKGEAGVIADTETWADANDPLSKQSPNPSAPSYDDSSWKLMTLPTAWEEAGLPDFDGVVWFRKDFVLNGSQTGKDLTLNLGPIDDRDTTWVNGVRVGGDLHWDKDRHYTVPASALHAGTNVISVRVLDTGGSGGIDGRVEQMHIDGAGDPIPLAGPWRYSVSAALASLPAPPVWNQTPLQNEPTMLYNAMVAPLIPFGVKGAIWYQGESNAGSVDQAMQYRRLLPTMIGDWRGRWGEGDFPFLIVQLANYTPSPDQPVDDAWARLREAQALTAKNVKNVGLATAIDIGDPKDIHPKNKQEVGRRLELVALAKVYRSHVEYSGPEFDHSSLTPDRSAVIVTFRHANGLTAHGDKVTGFAIAGADRKFYWADAKIAGNTVIVSSPQVPAPVAVRYAWSANPVCDLYNGADLPATPFQSVPW